MKLSKCPYCGKDVFAQIGYSNLIIRHLRGEGCEAVTFFPMKGENPEEQYNQRVPFGEKALFVDTGFLGDIVCSNCNSILTSSQEPYWKYNFCPYCGRSIEK